MLLANLNVQPAVSLSVELCTIKFILITLNIDIFNLHTCFYIIAKLLFF